MRQLKQKQKQLLNQFFESRIERDKMLLAVNQTPFKNADHNVGIDEMYKYAPELLGKLEQINDTEILQQEIDRYLNDKSVGYIHRKRR